jgi:maltose O-acetyltransferase
MIRRPRRAALEGEAYRVHHSTNRRAWHFNVNVLAASGLISPRARLAIYRANKLEVATLNVLPGCFFYGHDVAIGADTWVNHRCYFDTRGRIEIGRHCDLGMEVMFCSSSHEVGPPDKRAGTYFHAPIVVEDGVWIGTRATILPGVTIGRGCVIAAGAVVRDDCAPDGLYAGVPARRVRSL